MSLEEIRREEFPECVAPDAPVFLNSASYGLIPRSAREASEDLTEARSRPGGISDDDLTRILEGARGAASRLVGGEPGSVSLAPNTSYGLNLAAHLLAGGPPGAVVLSDGEFPANVHPWKALESRGFRLAFVPTDELGLPREDAMLRALKGDDVRALALSAVQFATGYLADLVRFGEVCRDRGILYVVDAIQALGVVPLDVEEAGIDVLASGAQKWLCSPWGSGFVYLRPGLGEGFDPPMVSWLGTEDSRDLDHLLRYRYRFLPDGRKFELATLGIQDHAAMARSLELIDSVGPGRIREHVLDAQEPLVEWAAAAPGVVPVTPLEESRRAGIFSFRVGEPERVADALRDEGFVTSVRNGGLRISTHLYNDRAQIERLVGSLDGLV